MKDSNLSVFAALAAIFRLLLCIPAYFSLCKRSIFIWQVSEPSEIERLYPRELEEIRRRWHPKYREASK